MMARVFLQTSGPTLAALVRWCRSVSKNPACPAASSRQQEDLGMVRQGSGKEKNLLAGDPDRPRGTDTRSRSQEVICLADCPLLPLDSGSSLASELTHWHMPRNQHASRSQVARVGGYTGTLTLCAAHGGARCRPLLLRHYSWKFRLTHLSKTRQTDRWPMKNMSRALPLR